MGGLVVSIDFELYWGYRQQQQKPLSENQIEVDLNRLKALLDRHNIYSTWAIVGELGASDSEIQVQNNSDNSTLYRQREWIKNHLLNDPKVEIGSHSSRHIFYQEITAEQVRADLTNAYAQLHNLDTTGSTIVYPRNQYDANILSMTERAGFQLYRATQSPWWLQSSKYSTERKLVRLFKHVSEFIPQDRSVRWTIKNDHFVGMSDSRFFRLFPEGPIGDLFTKLYRSIIQYELQRSLSQRRFYHIWFHPHNFMTRPHRLDELDAFFRYFNQIRKRYDAQSHHMRSALQSLQ